MNYYKISKDNWSSVQKFNDLNEAQNFANSLGSGYEVEYYGEVVEPTIQERLRNDIDFGNTLVYTFVEDNRTVGTTQEQNDLILSKFRDILAFAQTGAIQSISAHLPNVPLDEVYTQERKDKYVSMVEDYLAQY